MSERRGNLSVHTTHADGGALVELSGEVDLRSSPDLHGRLIEISDTRPAHLILELSGVNYMDSSGVGTMVDLKRRVEGGGGRFVLVGLQPRVRSVLEITQLDKFFTITSTVDEARKR